MTTHEELRGNFINLMGHDVKSSLLKVQSICNQMVTKGLPSKHYKELQELLHKNKEIHYYINEILKAFQLESKDISIYKCPIDINKIIENGINQLNSLAKEKNILIEKRLEPMLSAHVDKILIREVIINIIENAIKYSEDKGRITIQSKEEGHWVRVEVVDQGVGMNEAEQERAFDKFYRASHQSQHVKGSGLGLYLVKYFIELHEGKVSLESYSGYGTKVQIDLPKY